MTLRRGLVALVLFVLGAALAACSDGIVVDNTPDTSPTPTWTARQRAVIDAYDRYDAVINALAAGKSLDLDKVHAVASDPFGTAQALQARSTASAGVLRKGLAPPAYPLSVKVSGSSAVLGVCIDYRMVTILNVHSRPPAPVPPPDPEVLSRVTLVRSGSGWLVTGERTRATSCVPA